MTTSTRTIAAAAFVVSTAVIGAAQQPTRDNLSSPTGTSAISGVVITDDSSGRPLRRAQVRISGGDIRTQPLTLTDNDGRFIFANLPAGRYTLSVSKPGYVNTYYGAKKPGASAALSLPITLTDGQRVSNIQVRVLHGGVITGTLRDENGRPVPNNSVTITGARLVSGRIVSEFTPSSGSSQTDDRGIYRVYGLAPGTYMVATMGSFSGNTSQRLTTDDEVKWAERRAQAAGQGMVSAPGDLAALTPPPLGRPVAYTPVYYPGVVDPQSASIVTVGPAEERSGIDFAMRLVPTARLDGVVIGLDGQPATNAQVLLTTAGSQGRDDLMSLMMLEMLMASQSRTGTPGKFSFAAIKPGEYIVTARASSRPAAPAGAPAAGRGAAPVPPVMDLWAETPITVDGNDLPGITLTLQPGMTIAGRVVFDGSIPPADITKVRVSLQLPPTSGLRGVPSATVNADGSFELAGVTPGAYRIDAYAPGFAMDASMPSWSLRSASFKGQNLTDLPFEVRPNESLSGVTITFTDKTTEVSGTLFDSAGRPAPDYYVMAYPADRKQWFQTARALRTPVRPDSAGKYTIKALPAGDYYICALPDFEQSKLYDPSFLEQLVPGSIKLSLVEGEKKTQNMKLAGGGW
jgi:protocatechuate 3,4-dioxygenase beta subunit